MSLEKAQKDIEDVKSIMYNNITKAIERDHTLSDLEDRSALLETNATIFKRQSTKLRKSLWCEDKKRCCIMLTVATIVLTVIILIIVSAHGGFRTHTTKLY
jgi:hypothetical protein